MRILLLTLGLAALLAGANWTHSIWLAARGGAGNLRFAAAGRLLAFDAPEQGSRNAANTLPTRLAASVALTVLGATMLIAAYWP